MLVLTRYRANGGYGTYPGETTRAISSQGVPAAQQIPTYHSKSVNRLWLDR